MTQNINTEYEDFLRTVLEKGTVKGDRTGTGTISKFGLQMSFDLSEGLPVITTKKLHLKSIIYELLWLLRGEGNSKWLQENGVTIWDEWSEEDGNLGPLYPVQWRAWPDYNGGIIDQIANVISEIKVNPDSRRLIVSAWNVGQLEEMNLLPCHAFYQFYVEGGKLSLKLTQRSGDSFLGVPYNITSYALLTHMIAQQTGLEVGELIWSGGDCHIYLNHLDQVKEQLSREPYPFPTLKLNKRDSIDDYQYEDFEIVDYVFHPAIKAPVAV